ncbi:MAG: murein biosynthesis integral membrane protein MurJ [Nitrospiraceae bacterium]|nr:murein biosynthesis integral membrane protein MurJ [Nitrospiraceae bacterium]
MRYNPWTVSGTHKIARAAGMMSAATLISRVLGFARDMVLAFYMGATGVSDAFYVSFRIPNLLREIFAEGTMSAALIPVLSEYNLKEGEEGAAGLVRAVFTFILIAVGGVCLLGIVLSPLIVGAIAPGFLSNPDKFRLTVLLTRIMFPFLLFISLGALSMGALNVKGVFFLPALSSAVLNAAMIVTVVCLSLVFGNPVVAAAIGISVGGVVQFLYQIPALRASGYSLKPVRRFLGHPGLKKMFILVLPAIFAMSVSQLNIVVSNILASFLPSGSITYLFYAMRLMHFPIGVFGVAMGLAVLPALSEHAVRGDFDSLRQDFSFAMRVLFFMSLPAMAGLIALRVPIISTLFLRGRFTYRAVEGTAGALFFYSLGIWAMVGARVLASAFYSMRDTKGPVKSAVFALASNLALSVVLMRPMKHEGLALANAIAATINFGTLFYMLRKKLVRIDARRIIKSFLKSAFAAAVMGVAAALVLRGTIWRQSGHTAQKALWLAGGIAFSLGIYTLVCYLLKTEELHLVLEMLQRRFLAKRSTTV